MTVAVNICKQQHIRSLSLGSMYQRDELSRHTTTASCGEPVLSPHLQHRSSSLSDEVIPHLRHHCSSLSKDEKVIPHLQHHCSSFNKDEVVPHL